MENSSRVNEIRLEVDNKTFWFKIGLRGIIYLQSLPKINVEEIFIAGIITLQPEMPRSAIARLWQQVSEQSSIDNFVSHYMSSFLLINVRDLYSQIVGEMGISPAIFLQMTPDECELAYQGYLRRQTLAANLNKLAFTQALAGNTDEINLLSTDEYIDGTMQERDQTFSVLGMKNYDNL